jgi:hypothetical protein
MERDPQVEVLLSKTQSSIIPLPWRQLQPLELSRPDQLIALTLRQSIPKTVTDYNRPPIKFLLAFCYGLDSDQTWEYEAYTSEVKSNMRNNGCVRSKDKSWGRHPSPLNSKEMARCSSPKTTQ